jgi:GH25 family lysozyme M1 (1,4-beta-N-acetylmuramidase)
MKLSDLIRMTPAILLFGACGPLGDEGSGANAGYVAETDTEDALTRACATAGTLRGIDVSYYQGTIDWDRVKDDGVEFAFIRVSDGLANPDSKFARNWAEAKRVGLRRGAYQYFRPNRDATAQADLLLGRMGALEAGDLPPVIDVETSGGLSSRSVASRVHTWLDHVESQTGVTPIIYTGPYFWRDSVGGPSFGAEHPLWVAHYTTGCPLVPNPWNKWTFHQFTESGRVSGISGGVDTNRFDGTAADLDALGFGGGQPPPPPSMCDPISQSGGVIEEDNGCVELGGPTQYLRSESSGSGGSHVWTGTTDSQSAENFARWTLTLELAGTYRLEAYVDGAAENARDARYQIAHPGGSDEVFVDQSTAAGFVELGTFDFSAGTANQVRIDDNTGEPSSLLRRVIIDALRLTPVADVPCKTLGLASGVNGLNVRPRPNTESSAVAQLAPGDMVERLATVSGQAVASESAWHRVRVGNTVGYVSAHFTVCGN